MGKVSIIENLRKNLPWTDFLSVMESEGFILSNSIKPFVITGKSGVKQSIASGNVMLVDDCVQAGAIRDVSHLYIEPHVIFRPKTEIQLKKIVANSQKFKIPITFTSGKTGLSGGYANFGIIVDLADLHTLSESFAINVDSKSVVLEQGVLISDLIKWIPYKTQKKYIFPVQPASAYKLPVRVGGLISTNASGVTSGLLGAAEDWIDKIRVMRPNGSIIDIDKSNSLFKKIVGGSGFFGVVLSAIFTLYEPPSNLTRAILFGQDLASAFDGLQSVLGAKIYPLFSEFVMSPSELPRKFENLNKINKKKEEIRWIVLLKGSSNIIEEFIKTMKKITELTCVKVSEAEFKEFLQERATMALLAVSIDGSTDILGVPGFEDILVEPKDLTEVLGLINKIFVEHGFRKVLIGYGHINFRKGRGLLLHTRLPVPVEFFYKNNEQHLKAISETIYDVILAIKDSYKIKIKAEHASGPFQIWLDSEIRQSLRHDVNSGEAFVNPHLMIFDELLRKKLRINFENLEDLSKIEETLSSEMKKELFVSAMYLYLSGA